MLVLVLLVAAVTDFKHGKIYNWLTLPAMLCGLLFWFLAGFIGSDKGIGTSFLTLLCGLVPFSLMALRGWLGGGDAKLMGAVGAISASWQVVLGTAFYGLIVAMLMAIYLMIHHGLIKQTFSRIFGAILSAAARVKPDLENEKHTVPFGTAVALGGILAAAEHLLGLQLPWT